MRALFFMLLAVLIIGAGVSLVGHSKRQTELVNNPTPNFSVGECIMSKGAERWENPIVFKVIEIGDRKYRTVYTDGGAVEDDMFIREANENFKVVECPKKLVKVTMGFRPEDGE